MDVFRPLFRVNGVTGPTSLTAWTGPDDAGGLGLGVLKRVEPR